MAKPMYTIDFHCVGKTYSLRPFTLGDLILCEERILEIEKAEECIRGTPTRVSIPTGEVANWLSGYEGFCYAFWLCLNGVGKAAMGLTVGLSKATVIVNDIGETKARTLFNAALGNDGADEPVIVVM